MDHTLTEVRFVLASSVNLSGNELTRRLDQFVSYSRDFNHDSKEERD